MLLIAKQDFMCRDVKRKAGERFEVSDEDAVAPLQWGFAVKAEGGEQSANTNETPETNDIETMRAAYKAHAGKEADKRWKVPRLLTEIQAAGGTYNRRDMRAQG